MPSINQHLIKEAIKGSGNAQKEIFDVYAPSMLGICYRYTKSMDDAEEVLMDGFVQAFKNIKQYRSEGEFGAWLRKIMINTSLNFLKKNKRYRAEMVFDEVKIHPVSNDNPIITLEAKELASIIRQLPTGYQTIFNLHVVEGYSHVEIASMLGINEGTSRSQYARARNLLTEWLTVKSSREKNILYGK